jgi:protein MpaA
MCLYKRFAKSGVLLVLISTLPACSLFKSFSGQTEERLDQSYAMTGFRYEIPVPGYTSPVIVTETRVIERKDQGTNRKMPAGFEIQSFVEKMFYGSQASRQRPDDTTHSPHETASIKLPGSELPAAKPVDKFQVRFCERIHARLSSIHFAECMAIGLKSTGHFSAQGKPIMASHFSKLDGVMPTGRVLLIGGVHGNELSGVSLVFEWANYLRNQHAGEFVWKVVPVMNPDGLFHTPGATRTNANGVDLNRNLPNANWQATAIAYWQNRANAAPQKYPGSSPASEPETRWLVDEIDTFQPDIIIAIHAPYNLVDYDAPSRKNAPRRIGRLKGGLLGTYPGSLGNYAGVKRGIPVITIELPNSYTAISATQAHDMWSDILEWLEKTIPLENQRFQKNRHYARSS